MPSSLQFAPLSMAALTALVIHADVHRTAPLHAPAPAIPTLDIVASEFAFTAPDTVPAGRTRVRLSNRGREMHLVEIARLDDGHTAEELGALLGARRPLPTWATFVGGALPGPATPPRNGSDEMTVTLELTPGRYALLCPIPSPDDHRAHTLKGMVRTLVVVPARRATPAASARTRGASSRVVLDNYGFVLDLPWRAGRHRLQVENRAAQPHELAVFRLDDGKRVGDVVRWASTLTGPPPGRLVGGTTALSRGSSVTVPLTLAPGTYALLCFLPDARDGRSHVQHGMTREITVR